MSIRKNASAKDFFGKNQLQGIPKLISRDTNSDLISNHVNATLNVKLKHV